jgi:diaminopropionate ammonia-lyase
MNSERFSLYENVGVSNAGSPPADCADVLRPQECATASAEIRTWPDYQATPLRFLPGLALAAGIGELFYKDESGRFGLGSFKALGGAYAVYRYLVRQLAERGVAPPVPVSELLAGKHARVVSEFTVACATDGNHGRSVAWGAKMFGCACVIFIHANVSKAREAAIASYGARVVRTNGNYDDSVARAADDAQTHGWQVISDTSYPGYTEVPREVMSGYTVMVDETIEELPEARPPTHVFVQGGVGGLAAAVCAPLWWKFGAARPRFVIVEPSNAACLYASAVAGKAVHIEGDLDTVMAGLSCGEPSLLAWPLLAAGTHFFMHLDDHAALATMRRLAAGEAGDGPVVGGESGVAGLAGLLAICGDRDSARRLDLDAHARVLVFGTEGDTDAELFERIVGESGNQVRARQLKSLSSN